MSLHGRSPGQRRGPGRRALADLLVLRGDEPSDHALASIEACHSAVKLAAWLKRASLGETAAQLFPEPPAS